MRNQIALIICAGLLASSIASAQERERPRGRIPTSGQDFGSQEQQRPKGQIPGNNRSNEASDEVDVPQTGLSIILKNMALPAQATEIEGLVAAMDAMEPSQKFLEKYIVRKKDFASANELERRSIYERHKNKISQVDTKRVYWIEGTVRLGQYDSTKSHFPILEWSFDKREDRVLIRNTPSDQSKFRFLPMKESDARLLLAEIGEKRTLNVLVKARLFGWAPLEWSAGDLSATTYFDLLEEFIWVPNKSKFAPPLVIARGNPETQIILNDEHKFVGRSPESEIVLDQELIPILLYKNDPKSIDDGIISQMIINRWILERRQPRYKITLNSWPKFFDATYPFPNAAEIVRLAPAFREWIARRANELNDKVKLRVDMSIVPEDDCTAFVRLGISSQVSRVDTEFFEGIVSDEGYQDIFTDVNNQNGKMKSGEFYKVGPLYFGMPGRNLLMSNTSIEDYTKKFCGGYKDIDYNAWTALKNGLPQQFKPKNYPIGIVEIAKLVKDSKQRTSNLSIDASIKETRVIRQKDGRLKLYLLLEPYHYDTYEFSAGDQKSDPIQFASKSQIDAATSLSDRLPDSRLDEREISGPVSGDAAYDIIGVRPGMTLTEAHEIIASHFAVGKRLSFKPKPGSPPFTVFTSGTVYISSNQNEYIILIHDDRIYENKVLAIGRVVYSGPGSIDAEDLLKRVKEKYGVIRHREYEGNVFQGVSMKVRDRQSMEPCYLQVGNMGGKLDFFDGSNQIDTRSQLPVDLRSSIGSIDWFPWIGLQEKYFNNLIPIAECDLTAVVWIPPNQGSTASFVTWIADMAEYSRQMIYLMSNKPAKIQSRNRPKL